MAHQDRLPLVTAQGRCRMIQSSEQACSCGFGDPCRSTH
uniref:Uncharacterized protein n=1 Tax=Arundo donax TaxID=35708 RepID=A0A0A8YAV5_ARUDO